MRARLSTRHAIGTQRETGLFYGLMSFFGSGICVAPCAIEQSPAQTHIRHNDGGAEFAN